MAELEFMSPYTTRKLLQGVIPADRVVRPNWLQAFFGESRTSEERTLNFDVEFQTKNVMGMHVSPDVDVTPIMLEDYGHKELSFSYAKEGLNSPDYEEINTRRLGQNFGTVDIMANEVLNIRAKLAISEQRFENLHELNASKIIFTGGYEAVSEKHPKVTYNFGRTIITDATAIAEGATTTALRSKWLNTAIAPEIDLTTFDANGAAGKRAWNSTGGTAAPTPVKDFIRMVTTANRKGRAKEALMSNDAFEAFEADLLANYKDAADKNLYLEQHFNLRVLPQVDKYEDLNFRRSFPVGNGQIIDIYTYDAVYHTRDAGTKTKYVPDGYVAIMPNPQDGIKVYGRIMHRAARYAAMPRWINVWRNTKTAKEEFEVHMNYIMGNRNMDALVCWKVIG